MIKCGAPVFDGYCLLIRCEMQLLGASVFVEFSWYCFIVCSTDLRIVEFVQPRIWPWSSAVNLRLGVWKDNWRRSYLVFCALPSGMACDNECSVLIGSQFFGLIMDTNCYGTRNAAFCVNITGPQLIITSPNDRRSFPMVGRVYAFLYAFGSIVTPMGRIRRIW